MRAGAIDDRTHAVDQITDVIVTSTGDTSTGTHDIAVGTTEVVPGTAGPTSRTEMPGNELDRSSGIVCGRWRRTDGTAQGTDVPCSSTDRVVRCAHRIRERADEWSGVTGVSRGTTLPIDAGTGLISATTGVSAIVTGVPSEVANRPRVSTGGDV